MVSLVRSYFPKGGLSVTKTKLNVGKRTQKVPTAQKFPSKHKTNKTTTEVPPWDGQKYIITGEITVGLRETSARSAYPVFVSVPICDLVGQHLSF